MKKIEFLEKGSLDNFDKIIIFIHGWKGNKNSLESLSSILKIPNAKWIFLQAPYKIENTTSEYSWSYQHSDGSYEIDDCELSLDFFRALKILFNDLPLFLKNYFYHFHTQLVQSFQLQISPQQFLMP